MTNDKMVRTLIGKLTELIVIEISKEIQAESNPDIKLGLQKAEYIINKFKE